MDGASAGGISSVNGSWPAHNTTWSTSNTRGSPLTVMQIRCRCCGTHTAAS
jgi:hypothetical protein